MPHFSSEAPISCLPNELLEDIFIHVIRLYALDERYNPLRWTAICLVCRRWWRVAIGHPYLWTRVPMENDVSHLRLFLARSKRHTLMIVPAHDPPSAGPSLDVLDLIAKEAYRIRELFMPVCSELINALQHRNEVINAPFLTTLHLHSTNVIKQDPLDRFWFLSRESDLPSLTDLQLWQMPISFARRIIRPTLTHLVLRYCPARSTVEDMVTLLKQVPALEALTLDGVVSSLLDSTPLVRWRTAPPARKMVEMAALKSIDFNEDIPPCSWQARLLAHMIIPATCSLLLKARMSSKRESRDIEPYRYVCAEVDSILSRTTGPPTGPRATHIEITGKRIVVDFYSSPSAAEQVRQQGTVATGSPRNPPSPTVHIECYWEAAEMPNTLAALVETMPGVLSTVDTLCFTNHGSRYHAEETRAFYDAFANVRDLRVVFGAAVRPALIVDMLPARTRAVNLAAGAPAVQPTPSFPNLQRLALRFEMWHSHGSTCAQRCTREDIPFLIDLLLSERAQKGYAIERLHIDANDDQLSRQDARWFQAVSSDMMGFTSRWTFSAHWGSE